MLKLSVERVASDARPAPGPARLAIATGLAGCFVALCLLTGCGGGGEGGSTDGAGPVVTPPVLPEVPSTPSDPTAAAFYLAGVEGTGDEDVLQIIDPMRPTSAVRSVPLTGGGGPRLRRTFLGERHRSGVGQSLDSGRRWRLPVRGARPHHARRSAQRIVRHPDHDLRLDGRVLDQKRLSVGGERARNLGGRELR